MRPLALVALLASSCAGPPAAPEAIVIWVHPVTVNWLPEGDRCGDEYKRGNTYAWAITCDGPADIRAVMVEVRLETSRHRGCAINSGDDTLPDMYLEQDLNPAGSSTLTIRRRSRECSRSTHGFCFHRGRACGWWLAASTGARRAGCT